MNWLRNKINQRGGKYNVAIQDSEVTINLSAHDMLVQLGQKGDYEGVIRLMKEMQDHANRFHPYFPHYKYVATDLGDSLFVEHVALSKESAAAYPLSYRGQFKILEKELEGYKNLQELMHDAFLNQRSIKIDMFSFKAFIGEEHVHTPFLEENRQEAEWHIRPQPLPEAIKVKIVLVDPSKEITLVDYAELNISHTDREQQTVVINNKMQKNKKLFVSLSLQPNQISDTDDEKVIMDKVKFDFSIPTELQNNVESNFIFLKMLKTISENQNLTLSFINLTTGLAFMSSSGFNPTITLNDNFDKDLQLIERLFRIEQHFSVKFELPESLNAEDYELILILESIIAKKPISKMYNDLTLDLSSKEALSNFLRIFDFDEPIPHQLSSEYTGDDQGIELYGVKVPIKRIKITYKSTVPEDVEKMRRKYADMDEGEVVKVKFIPGENNILEEEYFYD